MDEIDRASRLRSLSDEVLRKIGRNVLLFQRIEGLMKYLLANHRASGTTTDFAQRRQERADKINKTMMGALVEDFADNFLSDAGEIPKEPENLTQPSMNITIRIIDPNNSDLYESYRADMKQMVAARNDLIHHFLPRWQPDSIEGLTAAVSYLDEQREKVLPMLDKFETYVKALQSTQQKLAAYLTSKEGQREIELMMLQQSSLIALLREISLAIARPDGWAYLAHAGKLLRDKEAEAVSNLKARYGHSTLKQLLIASELFDVWDEPLTNGKFSTVYRAKRVITP